MESPAEWQDREIIRLETKFDALHLDMPSMGYRRHIKIAHQVMLETLKSESEMPFKDLEKIKEEHLGDLEEVLLTALRKNGTYKAFPESQKEMETVMRNLILLCHDEGMGSPDKPQPTRQGIKRRASDLLTKIGGSKKR